jgi:hypothetical protein
MKARGGISFPLDAGTKLIIIATVFFKLNRFRRYDMRGLFNPGAIVAAALVLSGCNEMAQPVVAAPPQASGPSLANLPPDAACSQAIGAYQSVIQRDNDTGNVNESVYHQIEDEISRAAAACSAGRDGEARSLLAASKNRHGYHM